MHYFFLEDQVLMEGLEVRLKDQDLNHAFRALRLREGELVGLADGRGEAYSGTITVSSPGAVGVLLKEKLPGSESPLQITLVQGLVKGEKFDQIIRHAVELGVWGIQPLLAERSIPAINRQKEEKKIQRWQKIVRSAAAQCRRAYLPEVAAPVTLRDYLSLKQPKVLIVPWEGEKEITLHSLLAEPAPAERQVALLIGPEGGFSPDEITSLDRHLVTKVTLGPRILRSETAAIAALSMVQAAWGDLR